MNRATILWGLFAVQAICCAWFLVDVALDFLMPGQVSPIIDSDWIEGFVTLALFLGLAFTATELRSLMRRQDVLEDQMKLASGAFSDLLEKRFDAWSLTEAERAIAVLSLKGFSIAEMAELRKTAPGTVKAQCAALYRKAGVAGRLQLLSLFLDDLVDDTLLPAPPKD